MHSMFWRLIEGNLSVLLNPEENLSRFDDVQRWLGDLFLDQFHEWDLPESIAQDLAHVSQRKVVMTIADYEPATFGGFQAWCLDIAASVLTQWLASKEEEFAENGQMEAAKLTEDERAQQAVRVAFGFLSLIDQCLLTRALIDRCSETELSQELGVGVGDVRKMIDQAKKRLRQLLELDHEISESLRRSLLDRNDRPGDSAAPGSPEWN